MDARSPSFSPTFVNCVLCWVTSCDHASIILVGQVVFCLIPFCREKLFWFGLSDLVLEGSYRFNTGEIPTWTNWKAAGMLTGTPEPRGHSAMDCAVMDLDSPNFGWEIRSCSESHYYICEFPDILSNSSCISFENFNSSLWKLSYASWALSFDG